MLQLSRAKPGNPASTLYSIECFPCLQDLARLKIALNILAHVPKSLLDPVLGDEFGIRIGVRAILRLWL